MTVVIIVAWLIASALVTVAVAWSLQLRAQEIVQPSFRAMTPSDYTHWYAMRKPHWPQEPGTAVEERSVGYLRFEVRGHRHPASSTGEWAHYKLFTTSAGWPFRCLRSHTWSVWGNHPDVGGAGEDHGFYELPAALQSPLKRKRRVSVLPVWWAVSLNFIVFAMCIAGVWHVVPAWFRAKRTSRGLCWKCAYQVGSSPVCTECGTPRSRAGLVDVALERVHVGIRHLRSHERPGLMAIAALALFGVIWSLVADRSTASTISLEVRLGLFGVFVAIAVLLGVISGFRKQWISVSFSLASVAVMIWLARATLALYASL